MAESQPGPSQSLARLVFLPALLTLGVSLLRVFGEFARGPAWLFSREPGGWCVVSIGWLPLIFGPYFARRLQRTGYEPSHLIEARILMALGFVGAAFGAPKVFSPVFRTQLVGNLLVGLAAALTLFVWPRLWSALVAYAYAARIPEATIVFFALRGHWGTHYDAVPSTYQGPESLWPKFIMIGLLPELVAWVAYTVFVGWLSAALFMKEKGPRF